MQVEGVGLCLVWNLIARFDHLLRAPAKAIVLVPPPLAIHTRILGATMLTPQHEHVIWWENGPPLDSVNHVHKIIRALCRIGMRDVTNGKRGEC